MRRFPNREDLSPNADFAPQQPDWGGDLKSPSDARMNDYEPARDRSYPDAFADQQGYDRVQSGYIVEGYPEEVVMRKKPEDRPYYSYHPQRNGYEERDDYITGGNIPSAAATSPLSPSSLVSGRPQDVYAKVIKPSERNQNVVPRQPYDVDSGRPNFERFPDGSASSNASFALRPDGTRIDGRWHPAAAPAQRDLQPSRDLNHNISKPSGVDGPSRPTSQLRVYRPGERHIDGTPMFGDPSKDGSRRQATSPDSRPSHLPLPASMRGQYIDDLAATKTPHTQQDLIQAKALSQQRYGQPSYFQYPERDTVRQVSFSLFLLLLLLLLLLLFFFYPR